MAETTLISVNLPRPKIEEFQAYALANGKTLEEFIVGCVAIYYDLVKAAKCQVSSQKIQLLQIANILEIEDRDAFFSMEKKTKELNDTHIRLPMTRKFILDVKKLAKISGFTFVGFINKALDYYHFEKIDYQRKLDQIRKIVFADAQEIQELMKQHTLTNSNI